MGLKRILTTFWVRKANIKHLITLKALTNCKNPSGNLLHSLLWQTKSRLLLQKLFGNKKPLMFFKKFLKAAYEVYTEDNPLMKKKESQKQKCFFKKQAKSVSCIYFSLHKAATKNICAYI